MAYAIPMIQPETRKRATGYTGVSWTCLFFGPLPALYRGHTLGFVGMSLINLATFGLSAFVFIFVYNAWHYHSLLARGFMPEGHDFGEVTENVIRMPVSDNDNLDDIYAAGKHAVRQQRIRLAAPELSERLIDDEGPGSYWKK